MTITVVFDPPTPADSPAEFDTKSFAALGALNTWSGEANALAEQVNDDSVAATSAATTATNKAVEAAASAESASDNATATADDRAAVAGDKASAAASAAGAAASAAAAAASAGSITPVATQIHAATSKSTPADADELGISDSDDGWAIKRLSIANLMNKVWSALGGLISGGTSKATPVDADALALMDSAASNATKKLTIANLMAKVWSALGGLIAGGASKATPVDADLLCISDSAAGNATKYLSWANATATLQAHFDARYTSGGIVDKQTFTANGTWTKPSGLSANAIAVIDLWGSGSSGASRSTTGNAAGGNGGDYIRFQILASALAATETVVVGASVAGVSGNTNGSQGNASSITINGLVLSTGRPGAPNQVSGGSAAFSTGAAAVTGPSFNGTLLQTTSLSTYSANGSGGGVDSGNTPSAGGANCEGGAGGGSSSSNAGGTRTGGYSVAGGNGGSGGANTGGNGTAGTAPGGGGGAAVQGGTSGAGARGEVHVTIIG